MDRITRNLTVITVCFIAVAGLSGCAATANNVNADANAGATGPVAFGKFRLVRNGHEMKFGEGIFANSATLQVYDADGDREMKGKVGRNGEFSWALEPGSYRIVSVGFKYHGERVAPPANFAFEVSAGHKATYVGTIMLEVSFEAGQYGTTGTVDRYTVKNDCVSDCEDRLMRMGVSDQDASVSLLRWEGQMAGTN